MSQPKPRKKIDPTLPVVLGIAAASMVAVLVVTFFVGYAMGPPPEKPPVDVTQETPESEAASVTDKDSAERLRRLYVQMKEFPDDEGLREHGLGQGKHGDWLAEAEELSKNSPDRNVRITAGNMITLAMKYATGRVDKEYEAFVTAEIERAIGSH